MGIAIKRSKKAKRGFTLVELLISLSILVLAATAFVPLFSFASQGNANNKVRMTANKIAASVIEEIRAMDYADIGIQGSNPTGNYVPPAPITINGVTYTVEVLITWASATGSDGKVNNVAFKNIRVIVKAPGVFSGTVEKQDEIHSLVAREGEEPLVKAGHLRVSIKDMDEQPVSSPSVTVNALGGPNNINQTMITDYSGKALFGVLNAGTNYTVKAKLPENMVAMPDESVDNDGWVVRNNLSVVDWQTTDVIIKMQNQSDMCHLAIKLVDAATNAPIITNGKITVNWEYNAKKTDIINNKAFTGSDFSNEELPAGFLGNLWPKGIYLLKLSDVQGYNDYDMSMDEKPKLPDGSDWDGTFAALGTLLQVTVRLTRDIFYIEDYKADFMREGAILNDVTAGDDNTLKLSWHPAQELIQAQKEAGKFSSKCSTQHNDNSSDKDEAFDDDTRTSWRSSISYDLPQGLAWDLGELRTVNQLKVYLDKNHQPKDFLLYGSDQVSAWEELGNNNNTGWNTSTNWDKLLSGQLTETSGYQTFSISTTRQYRYYKLIFTSKYDNNATVRVCEVQLFNKEEYSAEGYRISQPIDVSSFTSAPDFKISWDAAVNSDTGMTFEVYARVMNVGQKPEDDSDFTSGDKAINSGRAPGITPGQSLAGKRLWIMEKFKSSNDRSLTPSLDWLKIDY